SPPPRRGSEHRRLRRQLGADGRGVQGARGDGREAPRRRRRRRRAQSGRPRRARLRARLRARGDRENPGSGGRGIPRLKDPIAQGGFDVTTKFLTTANGVPVSDNQNSLTAGERGPIVFEDFHLFEKLAHFNRERIPERVVHAKGSGAFGELTVTTDITRYTRARLFSEVGKKTPLFIRFSTVGGEAGSADTQRDPRGFA